MRRLFLTISRACVCLVMVMMVVMVRAQESPSPIPTMTKGLADKIYEPPLDKTLFINLWKFALEKDAPRNPTLRGPEAAAAGTILAPTVEAEMHLIPQDAADIRYGDTKELKNLRHAFLLDHLISDPLAPSDSRLSNGITLKTLSGKSVTLKKDAKGKIFVNGVGVEDVYAHDTKTYVYLLEDILFDNREKVDAALYNDSEDNIDSPLGPPLDIPEPTTTPAPPPESNQSPAFPQLLPDHAIVVRAPAPPPGFPQIPSPPIIIRPPAPPRSFPRPPAPPRSFPQPPAPPRSFPQPPSPPLSFPQPPEVRGFQAPPQEIPMPPAILKIRAPGTAKFKPSPDFSTSGFRPSRSFPPSPPAAPPQEQHSQRVGT